MEKSKLVILVIMFTIIMLALFTSKKNPKNLYEVKRKLRLLPFWAKYLGIVISILALIIHLVDKFFVLSSFWQFILTVGLLIIGLSEEKNEDEMIMSLRLNAIFIAFFGGVIVHILYVLLDIFLGGTAAYFSSMYVTNFIIILYLINFYSTKKRINE
ncbi:hypothetical protein [Zunongwangia sp.]|uniref:hypothetical protein n=1 Tax=Zunongwangia sp. TaxID=1965325 RepID=UPI003AA9232C